MEDPFGKRVRKLRLARSWSQQELSLRAGISTPHISSIERDLRHPSLEYAKRMADALGVSLSALCDEDADFAIPKMKKSPEDWPLAMQNFILNEGAAPYLEAAKRMSTLSKEEMNFLTLIINLLIKNRTLT